MRALITLGDHTTRLTVQPEAAAQILHNPDMTSGRASGFGNRFSKDTSTGQMERAWGAKMEVMARAFVIVRIQTRMVEKT